MRPAERSTLSRWVLIALAALTPCAIAGQAADPLPAWSTELDHAESAVVGGQTTEALERTGRVLAGICGSDLNSGAMTALIGRTLTLRALAELATGDARAANWHWRSALALDPAAAKNELERFGERGERLRRWSGSHEVGLDGQPRQQEVILRVGGDVVAPRRIPGPNPACAGAPCQSGAKTRVILQFIIEERGEPSFPKVFKTEGSPAATLATLEGVRCWLFHPARVNKEPRAVYYTVVEGERR